MLRKLGRGALEGILGRKDRLLGLSVLLALGDHQRGAPESQALFGIAPDLAYADHFVLDAVRALEEHAHAFIVAHRLETLSPTRHVNVAAELRAAVA